MKQKIEPSLRSLEVPIDSVSLCSANVRKHGDRNLDAIRRSLRQFGQQKPIVVDSAGVVIAGNGTLVAALDLGWLKIAAIKTRLSGSAARAFAIADNRTSDLSSFNISDLEAQLKALIEEGFDVENIGFDSADVARLFENPGELGDSVGPLEAVTKTGDVWRLGPHRLVCGDSRDERVLRAAVGDLAVRLVVVDPPYCVGKTAKSQAAKPGGQSADVAAWDDEDMGEIQKALAVVVRFAPRCPVYCWFAMGRSDDVGRMLEAVGLARHQMVIWCKSRPVYGRSWYQWAFEPCWLCWAPGAMPKRRPGRESNVWHLDEPGLSDVWHLAVPPRGERFGHLTPKPIGVYTIPIRHHTRKGDAVLDAFAGSGTVIIAAEQEGRVGLAIERDQVFCDVIIARWETLTGLKAERAPRVKAPRASPVPA